MIGTTQIGSAMIGLFIASLCVPLERLRATESFVDDFTNPAPTSPGRIPATWRAAFGGSVSIEDGDLIVGKTSGLAGALVDGFAAKDVSVETRFQIRQGTDAGIGIRTIGNDVTDCYFGNLDVADGAGLFRCGAVPLSASVPVNIDATQQDVSMRLDIVGDQLSLWVWSADETRPAEPLAITHDSALTQGGVGVYINPDFGGPTEALFRYVNVTVIPQLGGDFNRDGTVDAADYVVWRKGLGTTYTQSDYDLWRAHFGQSAGSGEAGYPLGAFAQPLLATIPEPACTALLLMAMLTMSLGRRAVVG